MIKLYIDPGSRKGAVLIENTKTESVVVKSFILHHKNWQKKGIEFIEFFEKILKDIKKEDVEVYVEVPLAGYGLSHRVYYVIGWIQLLIFKHKIRLKNFYEINNQSWKKFVGINRNQNQKEQSKLKAFEIMKKVSVVIESEKIIDDIYDVICFWWYISKSENIKYKKLNI